MQERAGHHRRRDATRCRAPFFVLATQNPIEQEGTYPLPEAQLDRFLFKIRMAYPSPDGGAPHRRLGTAAGRPPIAADLGVASVATPPARAGGRERCAAGAAGRGVVDYVVALVRATRGARRFSNGAGRARGHAGPRRPRPRGAGGPRLVIPDDVKPWPCPRCAIG